MILTEMVFPEMSFADLSPLANHLWQSTLCATAISFLTLVLRKNRAAVRYWLWLAASVKFLVPFSLLVSMGSQLQFGWRTAPAVVPPPQWSSIVENIGRPFSVSTPALQAATPPASDLIPAILFSIWLSGFAASITLWFRSWRRMRAARKGAIPLALDLPIPVMSCSTRVEPGVFGVRKPVLLLPEGITDRLTPSQFNAIVTHEMCHVRRRDNLTAAIHMLVETVFWFHPLVWWIRARLVEERERACDEAVLQSGSDAEVYAEGILNVCKFYIESPLTCVSGISGSDLKKRIVRIMTGDVVRNLDFSKKALLSMTGLMAIGVPVVLGLVTTQPRIFAQLLQSEGAPTQSFEVASIKQSRAGDDMVQIFMTRGKFTTKGKTTKAVIEFAYDIKSDNQLSGGPSWINSEKYDIEAKEEDSVAERLEKLPLEEHANQVRLMVQALLAERFGLKVSHETKDLPVYALVVAKNGPKLTQAMAPVPSPGTTPPNPKMFIRIMGPGQLSGTNIGIGDLANILSQRPELGRLVIDQTGLKGNYDWILTWTPEQSTPMFKGDEGSPPSANTPAPDSSGPSIFAAVQEQLGLRLEPRKGPVETLVIDTIEKPSEN